MFLLLLAAGALAQSVNDWQMEHTWADSPAAYFEGGHRDLLLDHLGGEAALQQIADETTPATATLWVPESYTPDGSWGVFVFINSNARAVLPGNWQEPLEERKLIFVAPQGIGNEQETPVRISRALDALASVEAEYVIAPDRRVVSGFSGGAAVSVLVGSAWPDVFVGTIDQCRALMWEEHPISTEPDLVFLTGEITHMEPALPDLANDHRFAFISGENDAIEAADGTRFSNYEGLMKGLGDWWARDLRARLFDVPGMGHHTTGPYALGLALDWVLECEDSAALQPRFDSDHKPPYTPVPAPEETPPDPCDEGGDGPRGGRRGEQAGDGCGSGGSWLFLPLLSWLFRPRTRADHPPRPAPSSG